MPTTDITAMCDGLPPGQREKCISNLYVSPTATGYTAVSYNAMAKTAEKTAKTASLVTLKDSICNAVRTFCGGLRQNEYSRYALLCSQCDSIVGELTGLIQECIENANSCDCNNIKNSANNLLLNVFGTNLTIVSYALQIIDMVPEKCRNVVLKGAGENILKVLAYFYDSLDSIPEKGTVISIVKGLDSLGVDGAKLIESLMNSTDGDETVLSHVNNLLSSAGGVSVLKKELNVFEGTKLGVALLEAVKLVVLSRLLESACVLNRYKNMLGFSIQRAPPPETLLQEVYKSGLTKPNNVVFSIIEKAIKDTEESVLANSGFLKREFEDRTGSVGCSSVTIDGTTHWNPPTFAWTAKQLEDVAKLGGKFAQYYVDASARHRACTDVYGSYKEAMGANLNRALQLVDPFKCSCNEAITYAKNLASSLGLRSYNTNPLNNFCTKLDDKYCKEAKKRLEDISRYAGMYHILKCKVGDTKQAEKLLGVKLTDIKNKLTALGIKDAELSNICSNSYVQSYANKLLDELLKKSNTGKLCEVDATFKAFAEKRLIELSKSNSSILKGLDPDAVLACDSVEMQMHSLPFTRALIFRILYDLQKPFGFFE